MVKLNTKLSDADKQVDLTSAAQGHVSQSVRQEFTKIRSAVIKYAPLKMEAREELHRDQFGNLYVMIAALLCDGELHEVVSWVGAEKWTEGGQKEVILTKEFRRFGGFNDACIDAIRAVSFQVLGETNLALLKARQAGKLLDASRN